MDAELARRISTALDGLEQRLKNMPTGEKPAATAASSAASDAKVQFLQNENQTLRRRQDEVKNRLDTLIANMNSQLKG